MWYLLCYCHLNLQFYIKIEAFIQFHINSWILLHLISLYLTTPMPQWKRSACVQILACHLMGAKPFQNQCWFAMNTALCRHISIKRHLITHFLNNKVKWLGTDPGTSWPRGWWRHRIFLTIWYHIPLTSTETYKAVRVCGATWGTEYQSSASRSQVSTGLGHQQVSVTTTADKWGAWNDQLKITIPINYVISAISLHH